MTAVGARTQVHACFTWQAGSFVESWDVLGEAIAPAHVCLLS